MHTIQRSAIVGIALLAAFLVGCSREARVARYLADARALQAEKKYGHAEIQYRNALELDKRNVDAVLGLGSIYLDQGRLTAAASYLNSARQAAPDNADVHYKFGLLALNLGAAKEAAEEATKVLESDPRHPDAPELLAQAAAGPEGLQKARTLLETLPPNLRETAPVLSARAMIEIRSGNSEAAETLAKQAIADDSGSVTAHAVLASVLLAKSDATGAEDALKFAAEHAPLYSRIPLNRARLLLQQGKTEAARNDLEAIVKKTPDFVPALVLLAEIHARSKDFEEAARIVGMALTLDGRMPDARLLSARVQLARNKTDEAIQQLDGLLKDFPKLAQAHLQMAVARMARNEPAAAVTSLNQAVALAPDMTEAVILLATLNIRMGDAGAAIAPLRSLAEKRPQLVQARFLLVDAYRAKGRLDDAIAELRTIDATSPGTPQPPLFIGMILMQQGKLAEARTAFEESLRRSPAYPMALEQLTSLDLREGKGEAARARLATELATQPDAVPLRLLAARVAMALQDTDAAESELKRTLELDPENRAAFMLLARLYVGSGRQAEALANLEEVLSRDPRNVAALTLMGNIHELRDDVDGAKGAYEKLLEINPRNSIALNNLAYLCSERLGDVERAYDLAQKARELLPYDPHTADTLGWVLFRRGEYSRALVLLEESAEKLPESAAVNYHLGATQYMLGQDQDAERALEKALSLGESFTGSDDCRARLSILELEPGKATADDVATLEAHLHEYPQDAVALVRLGTVRQRTGDLVAAASLLKRAISASPGNIPAMKALTAALTEQHELDKALEVAQEARKRAPDDAEIAQILGRLAMAKRDFAWAFSLLQEAARKSSGEPSVLIDFGHAAYGVGRVMEAEAAMQKALAARPDPAGEAEARLFLEFVPASRTSWDGESPTDKRVKERLAADPGFIPALMAEAARAERAGDTAEAVRLLDRILSLDSEFTPAMRQAAMLLASQEQSVDRAYALAMKARDTFPEDPRLAGTIGVLLSLKGENARAITTLEPLTRSGPANADLLFFLGMSQMKAGQQEAGRRSLQGAMEAGLAPDKQARVQKLLSGTP